MSRYQGHHQADKFGMAAAYTPVSVSGWETLSKALQDKFARAGTHGATRPFQQAQEFYNNSIPELIKNLGENAIKEYLQGKHASHIIPDSFGGPITSDNIIWEIAKRNLERGAKNMSAWEQTLAHATNAADVCKIVGTATAVNAAKGSGLSVIIEAPVSLVENIIRATSGQISSGEAFTRVTTDIVSAAIAGAAGGAAITALTALGAGPIIIAAAPVLVPVSIGITIAVSIWRIGDAIIIALSKPKEPSFFEKLSSSAWNGTKSAVGYEAPVSAIENLIYYFNGKKDFQGAFSDTVTDVTGAAVSGAMWGGAFFLIGQLGAAPVLSAIAPALGVYSAVMLTNSAIERWLIAADPIPPRLQTINDVHAENQPFFDDRRQRLQNSLLY